MDGAERDTSNELTVVTSVLAFLSVATLSANLAVAAVFRKTKHQVERLLIVLICSNMVFAASLILPIVYNGRPLEPRGRYCAARSVTYASQMVTISMEVLFIASTLLTVRRNRFIPFRAEIAFVVLAVVLGGLLAEPLAQVCGDRRDLLQFERDFSYLVLASLAVDAFLCGFLLFSINQKDLSFRAQQRLLLEFLLESDSKAARRQLQLLDQTHRDFQDFNRPLKFFPYYFAVFAVPALLFAVVPTQLVLQGVLLVFATRGLGLSAILFSDRETRSQSNPSRLCRRLLDRLSGPRVQFAALPTFSPPEEGGDGGEGGGGGGAPVQARRGTTAAPFAGRRQRLGTGRRRDGGDGGGDGVGRALLTAELDPAPPDSDSDDAEAEAVL